LLLQQKQVKKMISSYVGENDLFEKMVLSGELEIELVPQGTLSERIRAGGAGIGGFYTPTGFGTLIAEGKETKVIDGKNYVLELPLKADFSLIKAYKADKMGNLIYNKTARNFNPMMATAGKITIAEVEEIVPSDQLDPESIVTPGIYVQRLIKGEHYEKRIEQRTVRKA
ncbi:CoA transferase subunit A, partial [bacterium]